MLPPLNKKKGVGKCKNLSLTYTDGCPVQVGKKYKSASTNIQQGRNESSGKKVIERIEILDSSNNKLEKDSQSWKQFKMGALVSVMTIVTLFQL